MRRKFAAFALALAMSILGLAGAVSAGHYAGTPDEEFAQRDYEAPSSAGVIASSGHYDDPIGISNDGSIDRGGVIFPACSADDNEGSFDYGLRCKLTDEDGPMDADGDGVYDGPYDRAELRVTDQIASNVMYSGATCSNDGDFWCGETNNTNGDTGGDQQDNPGPNELAAFGCSSTASIVVLTRDQEGDDQHWDGTGDGVWNQTGEMYDDDADGEPDTPHPGVTNLVIFLWDTVTELYWQTFIGGDLCNGVAQWPTTGTASVTGT